MCKIPGCENETEYDVDEYCHEHWIKSKMTKDNTCPICTGKVDREHYLFVVETLTDPKKLKGWMEKTWTFEIWKEARTVDTFECDK